MHVTKRLARVLALALCVTMILQAALISASALNRGFSVSAGAIQDGGLIPVTVTVDGGYNLAGCKLKLRFDEGFLQYVRADFGAFGGVTEAGVSPDNSVTLSFVSMEAVATTQTFCTVWFRIVDGAVGTTQIEPNVSETIDANNQTVSDLSADSVSITVTAQTLTMTSQPTKKYYFCGEPLDTTGMTLVATFPNGSTKELADFGLFGFDTNSSGNQTITVRSGKHTASFEVVVARKGDVNCDDLVNLADYAMIVDTAVFSKTQPVGETLFRQDLMQDGAVDCFDAAYESLLISGIVQ